MLEYKQVKSTVDDLIKRGETSNAMALLESKTNEYARAEVADKYTSTMQKLSKYESAMRASSMSPEEKRAMLEKLRRAKTNFSMAVQGADDRTKPQAVHP
jgi:hypothetical protein